MNFEGKSVEGEKCYERDNLGIKTTKQTRCSPASVDSSQFFNLHYPYRPEVLRKGRQYNIDNMKVVLGVGRYWENKGLNRERRRE